MAQPKKANRTNVHNAQPRLVPKTVEAVTVARAASVSRIYKWHIQLGEAGVGINGAPKLDWVHGLARTLKEAIVIANLFHSQSTSDDPEYRASWFTDWRGTIRPSISHKECLLEMYLLTENDTRIKFYLRQVDMLDRLVLVRRFKKAWVSRNPKNRLLFKYYDLQGNVKKLL